MVFVPFVSFEELLQGLSQPIHGRIVEHSALVVPMIAHLSQDSLLLPSRQLIDEKTLHLFIQLFDHIQQV